MPIRSTNFPALLHLLAVDLNCQQIAKAELRLRDAAAHWVALDRGVDDGRSYPPIDVAADCTVCLASAAAIARSLFVGRRKGKGAAKIARRAASLMALLDEPAVPVLQSLSVRNSWEHMDERLDELLIQGAYRSVSEIHVAVTRPGPETFVLRHFDPVSLQIGHGPDSLSLGALAAEARDLRERVKAAIRALHSREAPLYG